jgi:hypothetical protein
MYSIQGVKKTRETFRNQAIVVTKRFYAPNSVSQQRHSIQSFSMTVIENKVKRKECLAGLIW